MKKIFLGSYKKIIKKAFSIGFCAALMLTMLPLFGQNFVAESASPTASETNTQNTIPIAMATDNDYAHVTLVSIVSALENADKDTNLKFYLMVSGDFSEDNKLKIQKVNDKVKNGEIEIINMGDSFNEFYKGQWGTAMYYRLKLPSILKHEDKCIYLDGDTLVLKDLKSMYDLDISKDYVAGVPNLLRKNNGLEKRLNIPDMNNYIVSGVLLMNLAKMREDNIENKFSELLVNNLSNPRFLFPDQDVISIACHGKIYDLPFKYGIPSNYLRFYDKSKFDGIMSEEDLLSAKKELAIIHFTGHPKPWKKSAEPQSRNMWLKYEQKLIDLLNS